MINNQLSLPRKKKIEEGRGGGGNANKRKRGGGGRGAGDMRFLMFEALSYDINNCSVDRFLLAKERE